jgi:hypothetical protein
VSVRTAARVSSRGMAARKTRIPRPSRWRSAAGRAGSTQERVDPRERSTRLQVEGFPHRLVFDTETYLPLAQEFYQWQEQTAVNMSLRRRLSEGAPFYLAGQIEHAPVGRTYTTGGFSSDAPGSESFYIYLLEARSQKINSGDVSDDIFNPKQAQ